MDRWLGKVAVVTGASSGIGLAIAKSLCEHGMIVIGLARRLERLQQLKYNLADCKGEFHFYICDVSQLDSIKKCFAYINEKFNKVHVLINNAGISSSTRILNDDNENELQTIINTNLMGALYCTKEAYKLMKRTGEECHIINVNSVLGHKIMWGSDINYNVYPSSKFALRAASEVLRMELVEDNNFHISNISPGLVDTEIIRNNPKTKEYRKFNTTLHSNDVAPTVTFILGLPKNVHIEEIIIKPVGEKF